MPQAPASAPRPAQRYVAWLVRRFAAIVAVAAVLTAMAIYLTAFHLPLRADFSHLLPQDTTSVRDLRKLEQRVSSADTLLILIEADDPAVREEVTAELKAVIAELPPELVARLEDDDRSTRDFLRAHRHLFVPLAELEEARDALRRRLEHAKLEANPLYIDLDEDESADAVAADEARLDELRARRDQAEAQLARSGFISDDERVGLLVVRTGFAKTRVDRGKALIKVLQQAREASLSKPGRTGVDIGFTAGVATTVVEHEALARGILMSALVTGLLVALLLAGYFRSVRMLVLLGASLVAGVTTSFGVAALVVGHLNAATAFLGAIIAGNGINYGILLLARYLEERRTGQPEAAMVAAIQGTVRPTIVASLGASIAYGSLAVTSFRGFADFAVIGGVGMLLCWIASFTLLPALVLRWGRGTRGTNADPVLGGWLARLFGFRRSGLVCVIAGLVAIGAGVISYRFVAGDPYEYDMTKLRSNGADAIEQRRWMRLSDEKFGRGISGQTFIAADRLEQVPLIVEALHRLDEGVPEERRTIGSIRSILDVVPPDQDRKLEVLAEIRDLLDDDALAALSDDQREELLALRPPDQLTAITAEQLPEQLASKLRERDGRIGYMVGVRPSINLNEWDGRDLIRFSSAIRRLELADGQTLTTSGSQVIYADIVATIRDDGPLVVGVAIALLVLMVLTVVGRNLRAVAVLIATSLGALLLVAVCAVIGLRVTFLDFVALPITLGLGVDYAINVAHRHHHGEDLDPFETLRHSGAAVFLCSLTTIIGYGSLLVSENLAIRGFGLAALIGEICCLLTALILVPAIVSRRKPRRETGTLSPEVALGEEPAVAR